MSTMRKDIILILIVALVVLSGIHAFTSKSRQTTPLKIPVGEQTELALPQANEYGLFVDSLGSEVGKISRNSYLSTVLANYNVPYQQIDLLVKQSEGLFDLRKIKSGNNYRVFLDNDDTSKRLRYFVYEKNPVDFVVFSFADSVSVWEGSKNVNTRLRITSNIITTTLWDAFGDQDVNPLLSNKLADLYAWTIDFFGLQKGDRFKVVYEEKYVGNQFIGFGDIKAAYFNHMGEIYYAIPFEQDSVVSFFDDKGNSLQRTFLKAPLRFSRISSGYTNSRLHPILKIRRPHLGIDYAAPLGTPVQALGDGTIIHAMYTGGAGNYVKIRHNSVYTTGYMHLLKFEKGIKNGKRVKQGDIIGYVGSTGLSTGPHLDFRCWKNGQPTDPTKIEAPPVNPIKPENRADFELVKQHIIKALNGHSTVEL